MVTEDTFLERHLNKIIAALGFVGLALSAAVLWFYWHVFGANLSDEHERWAQFGDYIGGILGSVFALLALIALLITLRLQSKELKNSAIELRNSAEALKEQSQSIVIQNFENRFFNMLSLHNQNVNSSCIRMETRASQDSSTEKYSGRACYAKYHYFLKDKLSSAAKQKGSEYKEGINASFGRFYRDFAYELGYYFRNIYCVLKFVHDSNLPDKKRVYRSSASTII